MTYYNLSFTDNTTGITELWTGVNTQSGGWFSSMFLISLTLLLFLVFKQAGYSPLDALFGTGFIISVVTGLLFGIGFVGPTTIGVVIGLFMLLLFVKVWGDS